MTNEEIEKKVAALFHITPPDTYATDFGGNLIPATVFRAPMPWDVAKWAHELVAQAYEEAAQIADGLCEFQSPIGELHEAGARQAAAGVARYIRALKDSLESVPV